MSVVFEDNRKKKQYPFKDVPVGEMFENGSVLYQKVDKVVGSATNVIELSTGRQLAFLEGAVCRVVNVTVTINA